MGLEAILKEMERQAALQIDALEGAAAAESQAVIAKAGEKAARIKEQCLTEAKERAHRERERLLSVARLDAADAGSGGGAWLRGRAGDRSKRQGANAAHPIGVKAQGGSRRVT
jgi:hypothetical protein